MYNKTKQIKLITQSLFIVLNCLFISSCIFFEGSTQKSTTTSHEFRCSNSSGNALFIVDQVSVPPAPNNSPIIISYIEGLANTFTLNLKACLSKSILPDVSIQNANFTVIYEDVDGEKQSVSTSSDVGGCIQWQEIYKYKYSLRSVWIGLNRSIVGEGAYQGGVDISMAVNPWLSDADKESGLPQNIDTRCKYSGSNSFLEQDPNDKKDELNYKKDGLDFLRNQAEKNKPLLWAPELSIQMKEVPNPEEGTDISCGDGDTEGKEYCGEEVKLCQGVADTVEKENCYKAVKLCRGVADTENCYEAVNRCQDDEDENKTNSCYEEFIIKTLLRKYKKACTDAKDTTCYKRYLDVKFFIPLEYKSRGISETFNTRLKGGKYNIITSLNITSKETGLKYELAECKKEGISLSSDNKYLEVTCVFGISHYNLNSYDFKLTHKITPVNNENPDGPDYLPLRHFEGISTITFLSGNQRQDITIDNSPEFQDAVKKVLSNPQEVLKVLEDYLKPYSDSDSDVDNKHLHLGATADFKFANIENSEIEKENVIERTVIFVGKICLSDPLDRQKLKNTKFRIFLQHPREPGFVDSKNSECQSDIKMQDKNSECQSNIEILDVNLLKGKIEEIFSDQETRSKFKSDTEKCITIPIKIPHRIYNKQSYKEIRAHILSEELNLYAVRGFALNPWQRAFQAFQDSENINEKNIRFTVEDVPEPELIINQFRSINLFPSYGIDKLLNIHIFHRFYLLFQPFIRRPDNVSLGLDSKSRELLRDGPYLVRVLILRNPKESGDEAYVSNQAQINENKLKVLVDGSIDLTGTEYLTHTDSVVNAKANFVNFYMPIHLSAKQMYYIASRNMIVIQIYPANPKLLDKDGRCKKPQSDTKNSSCKEPQSDTKNSRCYKPFVDHDLINKPYAGAINIQNWTNWNLLQPANIKTDTIIDKSDNGKKYRHFDFDQATESPDSKSSEDSTNSEDSKCSSVVTVSNCVNTATELSLNSIPLDESEVDTSTDWAQAYSSKRMEEVSIENGKKLYIVNGTDEIEEMGAKKCQKAQSGNIPQSTIENSQTTVPELSNFLENYTKENSLKLIELGTKEGNNFIDDLRNSYTNYKDIPQKTYRVDHTQLVEFDLNDANQDSFILQKHLQWYLAARLLQDPPRGNYTIIPNSKFKLNLTALYVSVLEEFVKSSDFIFVLSKYIKENKQMFKNTAINEFLDNSSKLLNSSDDNFNNPNSYKKLRADMFDQIVTLVKNSENLTFNEPSDTIDKTHTFIFMLLFLLPPDELNLLNEIKNPYLSKWFKPSNFTSYIDAIHQKLIKNKEGILGIQLISYQQQAKWNLDELLNKEHDNRQVTNAVDLSSFLTTDKIQESLNSNLINNKKFHTQESLAFFKSLCSFWFTDFTQNYLDKDLRISTYTNHIKKFDYRQYLDYAYVNNFTSADYLIGDMARLIRSVTNNKMMSKEGKECHRDYRICTAKDYCMNSELMPDIQESQYCSTKISVETDASCNQWVNDVCSNTNNTDLELCENNIPDKECHSEAISFCKLNPDKSFCADYGNRCVNEYKSCLGTTSDIFKDSTKTVIQNPTEPINTCMNDVNEFFKVENKMIVHEISNDLKYKSGDLRNFSTSVNNSIGSYLNWTAQRSRSISLSFNPLKMITSALGFGASISQGQSSNESNSIRRAWDGRAGEAVFLAIGRAEIEIGVKKFQKCVVIKPRPNAFMASFKTGKASSYKDLWNPEATDLEKVIFSRPGLILCNPIEDDKPETITESYYYISQANTDPSNSQFLDLYDLSNRPYNLVLRGDREFLKFYHLIRRIDPDNTTGESPSNLFMSHKDIAVHTKGLTLSLRQFNSTGIYPGIYDYSKNVSGEIDAAFIANKDASYALDLPSAVDIFEVPNSSEKVIPLQSK